MKLIRLVIIGLVLSAAISTGVILAKRQMHKTEVTDFPSCVAAGNPVQESFPEVCRTPDGKTFTAPMPTN